MPETEEIRERERELAFLDAEIWTTFARRLDLLGTGEHGGPLLRALESTIEQLDSCGRLLATRSRSLLEKNPVHRLARLPRGALVGCPGVPGAYTHEACEKFFQDADIRFYERFDQVVEAVSRGEVEYGVIPVENSSAGQVNQSLELTGRFSCFICADTQLKVEHCLCIHPDSDPAAIRTVLSHPQGLAQCTRLIGERGYLPEEYTNTSTAAKKVGQAPSNLACICSRRSARLYGLRILEENAQDFEENYTRFICFSPRNILLRGADTVTLTLSFPNTPGELQRLLTRFMVCDLDLCKIQSMPIASRDFSVRFHLDFKGSIEDDRVVNLLSSMEGELDEFHFLGNFLTVE